MTRFFFFFLTYMFSNSVLVCVCVCVCVDQYIVRPIVFNGSFVFVYCSLYLGDGRFSLTDMDSRRMFGRS